MNATLDPVTLDLIEHALLNARYEMDEVLRRAAMSPTIRVQHDEFPMICDAQGRMVVGQFGSYIPAAIAYLEEEVNDGDVILLNDPYICKDQSLTTTTGSSSCPSSMLARWSLSHQCLDT